MIGAAGWLVGACEGLVRPEPTAAPAAEAQAGAEAVRATSLPSLVDASVRAVPSLVGLAADAQASSPLALARLDGRPVAVLADADEGRVVLVDLQRGHEIAAGSVAGTPAHVRVAEDGTVYVSVRDGTHVAALELGCRGESTACELAFVEAQRWATPAEPIALGFADEGETLLVGCGWGRVLRGYAIGPRGRELTIPVAREPRGFVVDPDGTRIWIAHAVGSRVSVASLAEASVVHETALHWRDDVGDGSWRLTNVPRFAVQGMTVAAMGDEVVVPMVLAYPGDAGDEPAGYGGSVEGLDPYFPHEPVLVALGRADAAATLRLARQVVSADAERVSTQRRRTPRGRPPCLLPRAIAVDEARGQTLVACQDLGQVVAYATDGRSLTRAETARWIVGAGTDAVAVDPDRDEAWAWSPFDRRLDRLALGEVGRGQDTITLAASHPVPHADGRRAFHTPRAFDGRSCAGCHIDGRDDGLVWRSPRGMVQTPVLSGRLPDTAPFGWHGDGATLAEHLDRTFRRMRAPKPDAATVAALSEYVLTMPSFRPRPGPLTAAQRRGRDVFRSAAAGCDTCHADGVGTDAAAHHILGRGELDTPSLRFVGDTAPYMHDGRYATLRETLVHTQARMGDTSALGEAAIADLIAYLRAL